MFLVFSFFQAKPHNTKAPQLQYVGVGNFTNRTQDAMLSTISHNPLFTTPAERHICKDNHNRMAYQSAYHPPFDGGNGIDEHFQGEGDSYELLQDENNIDVLLN